MRLGGSRNGPWRALIAGIAVALVASSMIAAAPAASGETVSVIVRAADADAAGAAVEAFGGEVTIELPIVEGVAADVPASAVIALDARPRVEVSDNTPVGVQGKPARPPKPPKDPPPPPADTTPVFVTAVGGKTLWDAGYTGAGVTVAVIDTGIADVPDLARRVKSGVDFSGEGNAKQDSFGHGTFVAGLIAGNGTTRDGVAPGATVLPIKIAGRDGSSDVAHVLAALQWAVSFKDQYGIRVINLSLGTDSTQPYAFSPLNYAVEKAWDAGIVVVVSASNRGLDGRSTVTKPADDPLVITVGATNDKGTGPATDDDMAGFSGMGPTAADGLTKPDVVAPGKSVVSLRAPGSKIDTEYPNSRVDSNYFIGSGTSFSSAITAGGVALLLEHRPSLTPDEVKALVMENALPLPDNDPNVSGAGRLDVGAAFLDTTVGQANQNVPRSLGTGSLQADRGTLQTEFVNELGVPTLLDGLLTPKGTLFDQVQFLTTEWTRMAWSKSQWAGTNWYGTNWYGTNWYGTNWYSTNWYGATWYAAGWD